jgi:hypothetical protein
MATLSKKRYNFASTTLGAQLTAAATSITLAAALKEGGASGTNIPTLGTDEYLVLAIGDEVLYLTAYTSGATSGTVSRGQEGTIDATHANGTPINNVPTKYDASDIILIGRERLASATSNGALWTPTGFSSIPATFSWLKIILNAIRPSAQTGGAEYIAMRVNGDTGGNYNQDGTFRALNWNETNAPCGQIDDGIWITNEINIFNYARTDQAKVISFNYRGNNGAGDFRTGSGQSGWQTTGTAINSIGFYLPVGSNAFETGTEATLYGYR